MSYTPEKEDIKEATEHIETVLGPTLDAAAPPTTDTLALAAAAERELSAVEAIIKYKTAFAWSM